MKTIFLPSAVFILCLIVPSWTLASEDASQEAGSCEPEFTEEVVEKEPCEEEGEETEPEKEIESRPERSQRDIKYEIDRQLKDTGLEFERYYPGEARPSTRGYHGRRPQIEPLVFVEDEVEGGTEEGDEEEEEGENDDEASD